MADLGKQGDMISPALHDTRGRIAERCRKELPFIVMALPAVAIFLIFLFIPLVRGIPMSMTDWDGFSKTQNYVGLSNYVKLFSDKYFKLDAWNTIKFTIIEVVFCNVLGILLALAFQRTRPFNNFCRTLIFMPHVISLLLSAYMVRYIFNEVYKMTGIVNMLGMKETVIPGLAIIAIWRDSGYCMVIYLAALQSVDQSMYEVAVIEGANSVQRFFKVTLPLIVPSITANVTLLLAWGLKLYDYPMSATDGGGPGRFSESVNILIYKNIFPWYKAGYGQAMAVIWVIFIFIVTQSIQSYLRHKEVKL